MLDDGNAKRPSESVQDDSGSAADASVSKPALSDDLSHVSTSETNAPTPQSESRAELVEKARLFLISPQIRHEDIAAKRRFLAEKGLSDAEIDGLLQELPVQAPSIPPRTYPQPPPSNLPNLLIGLARILTWAAGGSAVTLLIYYRFLLPLLTRSLQARVSIKAHQKDLLLRLTASIQALKATQHEAFSVLPRPGSVREDAEFKDCHTLEQIIAASGETPQDIPPFSVLRCTLEEFSAQGKDADTDGLFQAITSKLEWMQSDEGNRYQDDLWQTLSTNPSFSYTDTEATSIWKYTPPSPPAPSPLVSSLQSLRTSMPPPRSSANTPMQHALQTISEFTGYLTTQIYAMPSYRPPGFGPVATLKPEEEELRKEIRALKGLVLNRRSFMAATPPPRASSTPPSRTDVTP